MNEQPQSTDEIDVSLVLLKISEVLSRSRVFVALTVITGVALGFAYSHLRKPHFESSLVIESRMLNYPLGNSLITTLQRLIDESNYSSLKEKLEIQTDQVSKIKSIEAIELRDGSSAKDLEKIPATMIKIDVQVYNTEILPQLENGIINHLEKNPYVKKRVAIQKANLQTLQERIRSELDQLDQLKASLYQDIVNQSKQTNITVIDPANVFKELIELYETELETRSQLELINNIQVIESFTSFKRSIKPNKIWSTLVGGLSGFFIVSLILFLSEGRRYLQKLREARSAYQTK